MGGIRKTAPLAGAVSDSVPAAAPVQIPGMKAISMAGFVPAITTIDIMPYSIGFFESVSKEIST